MLWTDDDIDIRQKRPVGRPEENPFPSAGVEEDFRVRAARMLELYYVEDKDTKLNFQFTQRLRMSKTRFWSIIFLYYVDKKGLKRNLKGFLSVIQKSFGVDVASDRTSISRCVLMLDRLYVTMQYAGEALVSRADIRAREDCQSQYQYVVHKWEGCLLR